MQPAEEREAGEGARGQGGRGTVWSWFYCVVTVISCFCVTCTLGVNYTFGNITPYVTSYLRNMTDDTYVDYTDTFWIAQSTAIAGCVCMPFIGVLANRLPTKLYLLIGALFNAAGLVGSYWTLRVSFPWTLVTYGVLQGIPGAIFYPTCLRVCAEWLPDRAGLISGIILMGYGIGSFIWTSITTWHINPDNLQPDVKIGEDLYYSQAAVLDKVPSCFLLLGVVLTSVQLLATLLICRPSPPQAIVTIVSETEPLIPPERPKPSEPASSNKQRSCNTDYEREAGSCPVEKVDVCPKEVLKSRVFWTLWVMLIVSQLGTSFVVAFFKAYGQTFIHDDHFLSLVASVSAIFNAVGRPFWGLLADRTGYRIVSLVAQCILAGLVVTFVTCEETGREAFFLWVCAMFLTMCGFFTMVPTLVLAVFGSHHFNVNMGLIETNGIVGSIIPVLIAPVVKGAFGWHGLFFVGFGGLFAGALLNMSISLQCGNTIPRHMFPALSL